jgi:hypothetical protein
MNWRSEFKAPTLAQASGASYAKPYIPRGLARVNKKQGKKEQRQDTREAVRAGKHQIPR